MEEYIRKSFVVPNAAIKVACFKAGMTEEMLYKRCIGLGCTEEEAKCWYKNASTLQKKI